MLSLFCSLSGYCDNLQPRLEVKQRKGFMLVKLHNYSDTLALVCVVQGSGNNLEADYDPEKVLRISGSLLNRGNATISIRTKDSDDVIARCDTTIKLDNATLDLPEVVVSGTKRPIKSTISHSLGLPSFMFTEDNPKLKIFKDLNSFLRNIGVRPGSIIYVIGKNNEPDPVPPTSISPSDIKQLDLYRRFKIEGPDIVVIQLKQQF